MQSGVNWGLFTSEPFTPYLDLESFGIEVSNECIIHRRYSSPKQSDEGRHKGV